MIQEKETLAKEKQPRKPRRKKAADFETVQREALRLTLSDQVNLCIALKESIAAEVEDAQEKAKAAQDIASGL